MPDAIDPLLQCFEEQARARLAAITCHREASIKVADPSHPRSTAGGNRCDRQGWEHHGYECVPGDVVSQ